MEVGVVRVPEDSDYRKIKNMCLGLDESFNTEVDTKDSSPTGSPVQANGSGSGKWRQDYNSKDVQVWIKFDKTVSDVYCIRVRSIYDNVSLATLYDVLLDPQYRKTWDSMMLESYEVCNLAPNTDIGYYSMKCPPPISNRDFVLLRSFLDLRKEIYVVSYSVNHKKLPVRKGYIRGVTYVTAFYATANENGGCTLNYVGQSDPKGKLPTWFVNKASSFFAPKFLKKLQKCCLKYPEWKKKHDPRLKPWLFPEQMMTQRLDPNDILPIDSLLRTPSVNEEAAQEDAKTREAFVDAAAEDD